MPLLAALLLAAALPDQLPLDTAALGRLPVASASLTAHGETQRCDGVWLSDLAAAAGLPAGDAVRGPALTTLIVAEAADGYRVAFSLAEIDAKLGGRAVLIATRCNGKPLDAASGPLRLVVPGEARAARSVRQLQRLRVVALP
jgi:Oxidoreductase molybdopterin binding domain